LSIIHETHERIFLKKITTIARLFEIGKQMTNILLINPDKTEQDGYTNPPLGLLYIAGMLLKNKIDVQVLDCCIKGREALIPALEKVPPKIVGITCLTPGRKHALEIAQLVKNFNSEIIVVMGGAHPSLMYKQLLENYPYIDYIVIGEGEVTFLEIAQGIEPSQINGIAYREGKIIKKTPQRALIENLDDLPFPAYNLVDISKYNALGSGVFNGVNLAKEPRISVVFSRGCRGHCTFCSSWAIWREYRHRSPKNMADEIQLLSEKYSVHHLCFADDALTVDIQATKDLCDEIIRRQLKIAFTAETRTDCVDQELLIKLKQAGCYELCYGIETGSPRLLKKINKENNIETSKNIIQLTKKAQLKATALIIVGHVGETKETLNETIDFLRQTKPDSVGCFGGLAIFPGTRLYEECKSKGIINDDFWLTNNRYKLYTLEHSQKELMDMFDKVNNYNTTMRLKTIKRLTHAKIRTIALTLFVQKVRDYRAAAKLRSDLKETIIAE
jgi:anaerobic magnesium-protoporphyrin IX monomethyl ester cyclase